MVVHQTGLHTAPVAGTVDVILNYKLGIARPWSNESHEGKWQTVSSAELGTSSRLRHKSHELCDLGLLACAHSTRFVGFMASAGMLKRVSSAA